MALLTAEQAAHHACNLNATSMAGQAARRHFHHNFRHSHGEFSSARAARANSVRSLNTTPSSLQPVSQAAGLSATQTAVDSLNSLNGISASSDLNFSSDLASYVASNSSPVSITVGGQLNDAGVVTGGTQLTINPGDHITAGQLEAVEHVLTFGSQSVLLNNQGQAVGGFVTLTSQDLTSAGNLYVPEAVSLSLINFNAASPLTIANNVNILGSVYSIQDTANQASILNFGSLDIGSSGLLSGSLPTLDIFSSYFSSSSLTLNVLTSVLNAGTISSPGALNINAGTSIANTGLMTASSVNLNAGSFINNAGTIAAMNGALNMNAASGQYFNSGFISAISNINIANQAAASLANINFDNTGGRLEALNDINFREAGFNSKADTKILGGEYHSKNLTVNGGRGAVFGNIDNATGKVNITAHDVSFHSDGNFISGDITATGDPFLSAAGNFIIGGDIGAAGEPITILASGDISDLGLGPYTLDGNGGHVLLAAGATFALDTPAAGTARLTGVNAGGNIDLNSNVSITNASQAILVADGTITAGPISTNSGEVRVIGNGDVVLQGNISGSDVNISVAQTNVTGNVDFDMTTGAVNGGSLANIQAGTIGTSGSITQNTGASITASGDINYTAPTLNLNSTSTSTGGAINAQGNTSGTNALTVNFLQSGATSALVATSGGAGTDNITFNASAAGPVTVTGGLGTPNGLINAGAGDINFNGGIGNGAVSVSINNTIGCVEGTGSSFSVTTIANDANLMAGNISATTGISLNALGQSADFTTCNGPISTTNGNISINAGAVGFDNSVVTIDHNLNSDNGDVNITSFGLLGSSVSFSNASVNAGIDINVLSGAGAASDVNLTNAPFTAGNDVFIATGAGGASDVNLSGSPVTAGRDVFIASGAGVTSDVNIGTGSAVNATTGSATIASGSLINSDVVINSNVTAATFVDVTSAVFFGGSERIEIGSGVNIQGGTGNGSGDGVIFTSDTVNLGANSNVNTTASSILLEGTNRLNVGFSSGAQLSSVGGNIAFNDSSAPTSISVTGGNNGRISSNAGTGIVSLNGTGNTVSVNVGEIDGCVTGSGTSVSVTTNSTTADLNIGTAAPGGDLTATNGNLTISSSRDINFKGSTASATGLVDVDAGRNIDVGSVAQATISSSNGDIDIDATNDFSLSFAGSSINTTRSSGASGNIDIQAGNDLTANASTTVNANGAVNGNGGTINLTGSANTGTGQLNLNGTVNAAGAGIGNGGTVNLTNNSSQILTVGSAPNVAAGGTSGNGGAITVRNTGNGTANGGIDLNVNLTADASGATGTNTGGSITLDAASGTVDGTIAISSTRISANGSGDSNADGGTINIEGAAVDFDFLGDQQILANAITNGDGGTVSIRATDPTTGDITKSSINADLIVQAAAINGDGGAITLDAAHDIDLGDVGSNNTLNTSTSTGNGGTITINVGNDILSSVITSNSRAISSGTGGTVDINVTRDITDSFTIADVSSFNSGDAGVITIDAGRDISGGVLSVLASANAGNAGTITVNTGDDLISNAGIQASSSGNGNGGTISFNSSTNTGAGIMQLSFNVDVTANGAGTGNGGSVSFTNNSSGAISFLNSRNISAQGGGTSGNGGTITVRNAGNGTANGGIDINSNMIVNATAATGTNTGGTITVDAASGTADGTIAISSTTISANGSGDSNADGGTINIEGAAVDFDFIGDQQILANASTNGDGGAVSIRATDPTTGDITKSSINADLIVQAAAINGDGGAITLDAAHDIDLGDVGSNNTLNTSTSTGNGGTITINVGNDILSSVITSNSRAISSGTGGTVDINVTRDITDSFTIADVSSFNSGDAGVITIDAGRDISGGVLSVLASANAGNAGTITVNTGDDLISNAGIQASSSGNGNGGTISFNSSTNTGAGIMQLSFNVDVTANGAGTGNGGSVSFTNNSSGAISFLNSRNISAQGGGTSGNGGTITVRNAGNGTANGGIDINSNMIVNATAATGTNTGGTITVDAKSGAVDGSVALASSTISANGSGDNNADGGDILIEGATVAFDAGVLQTLSANAGADGDGGTVTIRACDPINGNLTVGSGANISLQARGGSTADGDGGTVTLEAANDLTVNGPASNIDVNAAANGSGDGGTINLLASTGSGTGTLALNVGLTANGGGGALATGNGGNINITNNSSQQLVLNQAITVNSAAGQGNGGNVRITNQGNGTDNGGIDIQSDINTSSVALISGNGGDIFISSRSAGAGPNGVVQISATNLTTNGVGSGGFGARGGNISVEGSDVNFGAGDHNIVASKPGGGGPGQGGTITLNALDGSIDGSGAGTVVVNVSGNGTPTGNGGSAFLGAQDDILLPNGTSNINATGNGTGGIISVLAGLDGTGAVQIGGDVNATGLTQGGTITMNYADPTGGSFRVGGNGTSSFVGGSIRADGVFGPGANGGTITMRNANFTTNPVGNLNIDLLSSISANNAGAGALGSVNFNSPGFTVSVTPSTADVGSLNGLVNSTGTSVFINPQLAGTTVNVGTVLATAGDAEILLPCDSTTNINIAAGNSVTSNTGEVKLTAQTITNAGTVRGQTNARLMQDTLNNSGVIDAVTGDVFISVCTDNNNLVLNTSAPGSITADNGDINLNTDATTAGGTITVTGDGTLGSNAAGSINVGVTGERNAVSINVGTIVGCVTGFGTTFSVTTIDNNANLMAGNINADSNISLNALGRSADFITCGPITSTAGNISINAGAVGFDDSDISIDHNLNAGGNINIVSLGLLSSSVSFSNVTVNAGNNINVLSGAGAASDVTLTDSPFTAGNDVFIAAGAGGASDVFLTGSPVTAGRDVFILSGAGVTSDVSIGTGSAINATTGSVTIASGSLINSDVIVSSNITAATFVDVTSAVFFGGSERIEVGSGVTIQGGTGNGSGDGVILTSDTINLGDNSDVNTTASSILFEGTNRLNVDFGSGAQVSSVGGNIAFNDSGAPTSINITGGTDGFVSSDSGTGTVALNGAGNSVSVDINQIDGCVIGSGTTVSVTTNSTTADLNIGTAAGGTLVSTAGDLDLTSGRNIIYKGSASATGGDLNSTTSATGVTTINDNAGISGNNVNLTTPTLTLVDNSTVNTTNGNVNVQSNEAGGALVVNMNGAGNNSQIVALGAGNGNVNFNPTTAGQITVNNSGATGETGLIAADGDTANSGNGNVIFNGGTEAVSVDVNTIRGCVGGSGDPFTIEVNNGVAGGVTGIGIGNITQAADIVLTSGDNIIICGPLNSTAGNVTLTSGTDAANFITQTTGSTVVANGDINYTTSNLNLNSTSTATTGVINIQGNGPANAVTANFQQTGATSALIATNGAGNNNINFNPTTAGQITITGGGGTSPNGLINAGDNNVTYNGNNGTNNNVTVSVNQIIGCNIGDGNNINIFTSNSAGDILVGTAAGGSLNATGTITLDAGRDVIFKGGANTAVGTVSVASSRDIIVADNADASLTTNGDISFNALDGIVVGNNGVGTVLSNTGNIAMVAFGASGSGTNNIEIGANSGASGSRVEATDGQVNLVTISSTSEIQVGDGGDGSVIAGTNIFATTFGTGSDIDVGDDGGVGTVLAGGDIVFISSNGVSVGDDSLGTVRSTNGNINITANGDVLIIADEAGGSGSSIVADNGNISLRANGTDTNIEIGDDGDGSVTASGTITATTTGSRGDIRVGNDGGSGTVTGGGDINFNSNNGVTIGNSGAGTVTSTNGDVSITAAGAGSNFPFEDITVGLQGGSDGSSINANNGSITLTANGPTNAVGIGINGDSSVNANNNFDISGTAGVFIGFNSVGTVTATTGSGNITSGVGFVDLADNSTVQANGDLNVNAVGNTTLDMLLGTNASLTSTTGAVSFQQTGVGEEGGITINGGTINSFSCIDYHAGPNDVLVDVERINSIDGNRVLTSSDNPTSISFTTQNGDINFCAGTDINTSSVTASGGPITITANNGAVNLNGNDVNSRSTTSDAGAITITGSNGILNGGDIISRSTSSLGGSITLNGGTGDISVGDVASVATGGTSGSVTINTGGNVTTGDIETRTTIGTANNVSVTAGGNATLGDVSTGANTGTTGNITITTGGDLIADQLNSAGNSNSGGSITTSSGGDTTLGNLVFGSAGSNGGSVNSTSGGDLTTGLIFGNSSDGTGGSFTGTANSGTITTTGQVSLISTNGQGGSFTTNSQNVVIGGSVRVSGGTNGGSVNVTTTNPVPLLIGGTGINSIDGPINANGGAMGGSITIISQGVTVNSPVTADGTNVGTGLGGRVVFDPVDQSPLAAGVNYTIASTVSACGDAGGGIVGLGFGPSQNGTILVTGAGQIDACTQITVGNLDPGTGLPAGPPAGLVFISPFPVGTPVPAGIANPAAPYNTPLISVNATISPIPVPPTPTNNGGNGFNPFANLFNLLALNSSNRNLFIPLMPRDQTELSGYIRNDENQQIDPKVNKTIDGAVTFASNFTPGSAEHSRLSQLLEMGQLNQDDMLNFNSGSTLISPQDGTTSVKTKDCQVIIAKGAVAFVSDKSGNDTAVFNLHQSRPGGMKVVVGKKLINLPPGRMLLVSRQGTKDFGEVKHEAKIIGYRNPNYYKINDDMDVFLADFSLPSALKKIVPLRKMFKSDDKADRKLVRKILMNAVLLQAHNPSQGAFQSPPNGLFGE